jgi:hypothetical protein
MKNPIFAILWLVLLVFIAWPVAGFCAGWWILIQVCHSILQGEVLEDPKLLCVIGNPKLSVSLNFSLVFSFLNSHSKLASSSSRASRTSWRRSLHGLVTSVLPLLTAKRRSLLLSKGPCLIDLLQRRFMYQ